MAERQEVELCEPAGTKKSASVRGMAPVVRVHALCASLSVFRGFRTSRLLFLGVVGGISDHGARGKWKEAHRVVGGGRKSARDRRPPGTRALQLGGDGWEEIRRYVSRGVLGCTGGRNQRSRLSSFGIARRKKQICRCTQPSERRSCYSRFTTWSLVEPENGEGTLAASQLFTISLLQTVPANASAQSYPLLTSSSPPSASSISTPPDSSDTASRTISVSKVSKGVSPFTAPPLRCWCRPRSSTAIRKTRCSVRLENAVSLPLNVS